MKYEGMRIAIVLKRKICKYAFVFNIIEPITHKSSWSHRTQKFVSQ